MRPRVTARRFPPPWVCAPEEDWEKNQNSRSLNPNRKLTTTAAIKTLSIAISAMVIA
jgi:hypothetical protein